VKTLAEAQNTNTTNPPRDFKPLEGKYITSLAPVCVFTDPELNHFPNFPFNIASFSAIEP
jgi:hypothetical protein